MTVYLHKQAKSLEMCFMVNTIVAEWEYLVRAKLMIVCTSTTPQYSTSVHKDYSATCTHTQCTRVMLVMQIWSRAHKTQLPHWVTTLSEFTINSYPVPIAPLEACESMKNWKRSIEWEKKQHGYDNNTLVAKQYVSKIFCDNDCLMYVYVYTTNCMYIVLRFKSELLRCWIYIKLQ